jgi:hypothetical protein
MSFGAWLAMKETMEAFKSMIPVLSFVTLMSL